jgi:3-oxoadipate enol-lactonase
MEPVWHDVAGSGPGVLLLHSGVCDSRQWDPQWVALAERFRVARYDRRGFGRSPLKGASYSEVEDLLDVLDAAGVDDVAIVGSSAGGVLALQLAIAHPERVRRLVLLAADADVADPTDAVRAFEEREYALLEAGDVAAATDLNVETWLGPEADDATRELVREMQQTAFGLQLGVDEDPSEPGPDTDPAALATVTAPALVVSGGKDLDYFALVAAGLVAALPDVRHLELPWAGHLPNLERPAEVTGLLLTHLP